jgi:MFS family permease
MIKTKTENIEPSRILNYTFVGVFFANMLLYLGQQMSNSILPLYAEYLGAPAAEIGIVASAYAITALIFKLVSAPAIDTFNRKYILAAAIMLMAVAFIGFNFSSSVPMLIFFRLLQGTGQAFTATCCLALAADALPREKLATGIGYFSIAQAVMQAIGPTIGLKLKDVIGFNMTFITGAAIMTAAVLFTMSLKISFTKTKKFTFSLNSIIAKEALIPAILLFFLSISFFTITSFIAIYGKQSVGSNIGYFFMVNAVTLLFTRPLIGKMADQYGHIKVMLPTMVLFALSLLLISISSSLLMFIVAAFLNAFGYGACQPAIQSLCMKRVLKERRGAASCTSYIGTDLGSLLGPVLAGAIAGWIGYAKMWRLMTIPVFLAVLFVFVFKKDISSSNAEPVNSLADQQNDTK